MAKANTLLSIGECMIELTELGEGLLRQSFAGDSFNFAYYARIVLPDFWDVEYFTAIGTDTTSIEMLAFIARHNVGTKFIQKIENRVPGLYRVHVKNGERSFSYWRSHSAAKRLASDPQALRNAIAVSDVIFFSGITVAIVDEADRQNLLMELKRAVNEGRTVVFDPNIRSRLWANVEQMREAITQAAQCATIVMPSYDDELACFGDPSPAATVERYHSLGIEHIVVKNGAAGALMRFGGKMTIVPAVRVEHIVDTTSAGDSFNGTYLAKFLTGETPENAARFAAHVAAEVIGRSGAIVGLSPSLSANQ